MNKNTDPKKLDRSNIGDSVVIITPDGTERSATLTCFYSGGDRARFSWRTGPGRYDVEEISIERTKWPRFVKAIFPTGTSFLVTGESPVPAAVV